jgi:hypothetical protein
MTATNQNYINHIALVLDASYSMEHLESKVVKVTDDLVAFLAEKSKKDDEETRITVYSFSDQPECHIWDMDVFRLPSMKGLYKIKRSTALIDAVHLVLDDFSEVPEKYGKHDFMAYVLTDGEENVSVGRSSGKPGFGRLPRELVAKDLRTRLGELPANYTVLGLAPDGRAAQNMYTYGFAEGNVALWDASTEAGLERAVERIKAAHTTYVDTRTATGVRGTRSAFVVGGNVDADAIKNAKLTPLPTRDRKIVVVAKTRDTESLFFEKPINRPTKRRPVPDTALHVEIKPFVDAAFPPYRVGMAYYELTKSERVTADKQIAVVEVDTNQVYVGDGARQLLGLPNGQCRVKPTLNTNYKIFVESTSLNRHLRVGTQLLLLTK